MQKFALHNPAATVVLMAILLLSGGYAWRTLPREAAPNINLPYVIVSIPYFGVAPEDIEELVLVPLEKKLKELRGVKTMRATAAESVGLAMLEFEPEVDIDDAVLKVRSKVDAARPEMPQDIEEPIVDELNFAEFPILTVSLASDYPLARLKPIVDDLEKRIESVPGVLAVDQAGGLEREIQINVDPDRLRHYRLTLEDFNQLVRLENVSLPGGTVEIEGLKYGVRVEGQFDRVESIGGLTVAVKDGHPVYVRDVAEVADGWKDSGTISRLNGSGSISLQVKKRIGANIIEVTDRIKALIGEEEPSWPAGTRAIVTYDESRTIRNMLSDLNNNFLTGLALVVLVLFAALGLRNSLLVGVCIPFSMLTTFMVLQAMGITLNIMVLFSLVLAVGMVVDNAIVIVENIYRHYSMGKSRFQAALEGTGEVAWPIIAGSAVTNSAFIPLLWWPGIMGDWMWYLPVTVITANTASFFVSMIVNPVLCASFMKRRDIARLVGAQSEEDLPAVPRAYGRFLGLALRHRLLSMGIPFLLLPGMIALYAARDLGVEFFPETDPQRAQIVVRAPEGTAIETTDALTARIERIADPYADIEYRVANVGVAPQSGERIESGSGAANSNKSVTTLNFLDFHRRQTPSPRIIEEIRARLAELTGALITIDKEAMGPPSGPPVNIEIRGEDYALLQSLAEEIQEVIKDVPHLVDLKDDFDEGKPEIRIRIDRDKVARLNLSAWAIANTVRTAVNGSEAGKFREAGEEFDIVVRLPRDRRRTWDDIADLPLADKDGVPVPLSTLAEVRKTGGYGTLRRIDQNRTITVSAEVTHARHADPALKEVIRRLENFPLPPGYALEYTGQNEEQQKAQNFLSRAFITALLLIGLILVLEFKSLVLPLLILNSVILSLVGVFFGLIATGTPFGVIMTGLGVISLAGIVVNNAIVLIDFVLQQRAQGVPKDQAIRLAGMIRLRPVLLTAITSLLGLIPIAMGLDVDLDGLVSGLAGGGLEGWRLIEAGSETSQWWRPMAVAVIFGLIFSTALTLIVLPTAYSLLDGAMAWVKARFRFHLAAEHDD